MLSIIKVLVIDDNEAHAQGLSELLELSGFAAIYAVTGEKGIELALSESVNAVLLDLHLPDMTGYEVCRRLRSHPATANLAIVFHTAADSATVDHQGDAFLTYPVEMGHICHVIQGCVARRRSVT
ncbi:MAG TPA: response regulator [Edaphobacter sp.]|nr:response regulator [Edaphobacter sp.]